MRAEDGRIVIEPAPVGKHLAVGPHGVVLVPEPAVPTPSAATVHALLDASRR